MTDAIFETDAGNAVIRYYPSRVPVSSPSAGSARRAVIAALMPSLQALAEYLSRITGAPWTVVDAEVQDEDGPGVACDPPAAAVPPFGAQPRDRAPAPRPLIPFRVRARPL